MCFPVWYMYSSAMYYGLGGTFLEKEVEYPSLRVSPEVNCNQFTFYTITLSSAGACEVSMLNVTAAGRQMCHSLLFLLDPRKNKFLQQIGELEPHISGFAEKVFRVSLIIFPSFWYNLIQAVTNTERLAINKLSFQIISFLKK